MLEDDEDGFWLMVEGGDIDWAKHDNSLDNMIGATFSFDEAVGDVVEWIDNNGGFEENLLIVTADHDHYLTLEENFPQLLREQGAQALTTAGTVADAGHFWGSDDQDKYGWGTHTNRPVPIYYEGDGSETITSLRGEDFESYGFEIDGIDGMIDQSQIHTAMVEAITPEPPESRIDEILEIWEDATIDYTMVAAHRGGYYRNGATVRPENSISSIENSIVLGAEMVELDVLKSEDGEYVIMHDQTVDRTTTGTGRVDELTLEELKELNLIVEDTGVITSQKIPTLEEAFAAVDDQIMFNVDIKLPIQDLVDVMNIAKDMDVDEQVVIKNRVNTEDQLQSVQDTLSQLPFPVKFMPIFDDNILSDASDLEFIETVFEELKPDAVEILVRPDDGSTEPTDDPGFLFSEPVKELAAEYDVRLWINTLFANPDISDNGFINGFRNDILALSSPEETFGFWADAEATVMQTDESLLALDYLNENGFRDLTPKLVGFSSLDADTFAGSPSSGNFITSDNRETPFPEQPVQGFSGVQFDTEGNYWWLSDNGYGSKSNSADYLLRLYQVDPNFKTVDDGNGIAEWNEFIQLSDPNNLIPFDIVAEQEDAPTEIKEGRQLTGADFDPESVVFANDGTIWIGEEFGPYLLHFNAEGELIDAPIVTPNLFELNTLDGSDPLVIAHRGASGYRPEHTLSDIGLAAYNLGADQEVDFIEPDLVPTKDGVLIARHENALAIVETDENGDPVTDENGNYVLKEASTNVAELPFFSDRLTTKVIDGTSFIGWFSEDFTLAEIKLLRAKERIPEIRPDNTFYDNLYEIPTLAEIIQYVKEVEETTGEKINIYPETKHPTYFAEEGTFLDGTTPININTSQILIDTLVEEGFTDPERIFIQSFEINNLQELDETIMPSSGVDISLIQLIGGSGTPYDQVAEGTGITYDDLVTPEGLEEIAEYAVGIGPSKTRIIPLDTVDLNGDGEPDDINGDGTISDADRFAEEATSLVADAHEAGLSVAPYTFRSDDFYLPASYEGDPQLEYERFMELGTDGFFSDFPDQARTAVNRATADEVTSPDNPYLTNPTDANLGGSRGFEGMGYSPDRQTLYPLLEGSVFGDTDNALRIYEFDVASESYADELAGFYGLEDEAHFIGDMTPINDYEFLVIERDGEQGESAAFKKIFKVDLSNQDEDGFVEKTELVDLLHIADPNDLNMDGSQDFTFPFVTIENVIVVDENTIAVANDNNYPFSMGREGDVDNNEMILIELPIPLDLDSNLGQPTPPATTPADNTATPMMTPFVEGVSFQTLITIGEAATQSKTDAANGDAYIPMGIPDGQGVLDLGNGIIRLFTNSEVGRDRGYAYTLENGLELTGARINYMDIDTATNEVIDGGLAYDTIIDRSGNEVTDAQQINWLPDSNELAETAGFDRFCSANLVHADTFGDGRGFEDNIFLMGEETSTLYPPTVRDGTFQALDIANETLYAIPDFGYGSWESGTLLDTGIEDMVALVLGDDFTDAPIWLYVGEKDTAAEAGFLERNGLVDGQLYAWVANDGSERPADLRGTGTKMGGTWVEIAVQDTSMAGQPGYDDQGYLLADTLRAEAREAGAFFFSRPEDVDVNPFDGTQFAVANTGDGDGTINPTDLFGDVNVFDVAFDNNGNPLSAQLTILYDGDTPELNGVESSFKGIRNPDNLAWSADGYIYVQEDFAYDFAPEDSEGLEEASIWRVAPDGEATRIAEVDRSVVLPEGTTDSRADTFGAWETSGIIDVSEYYGNPAGTDFYLTVQAHGIRDGIIEDLDLVEGGQILHLTSELDPYTPPPTKTVFGTSGDDFFDTENPDDKQFLGDQQNLFAGSGDDFVDVTFATGGPRSRIDLGSGDDILFAGSNHRILAGSGDDILFLGSGEGNNTVTGGPGMDQFWLVTDAVDLPTQTNIITDFEIGEDLIGFGSTDLSFADVDLIQEGSNTVINALNQDLGILRNTQATALSESDFVFA